MDQIINAFGIDVRLIIIQMVNFAILMAALGYFLYKPVLKLLRDREEKITQGLKDAELAGQAKAEADKEKQVVLSAAHAEAGLVAERAKATAEVRAGELVSAAEAKVAQLLRDADLKAAQAKAQALKESEKEVAQIAILAAEKILRERAS